MVTNITSTVTFDDMVTPEEKQQLKDALASIPQLRENLRKAERIGLDVTAQIAELDESEKKIQKLLAELK